MKKNIFLFAALFVAASTILSSCSDDNDTTSKMPVFGELTVSPSVASPGDTLKATLTFSDQGSYVNGTYKYATNPAAVAGEFTCGSSKSETTFTLSPPTLLPLIHSRCAPPSWQLIRANNPISTQHRWAPSPPNSP